MINASTAPLPRRAPAPNRPGFSLAPYLFVLPAVGFYTVFMAAPIVGTLIFSLSTWSGVTLDSLRWAGADNYLRMVNDPVFWTAFGNTLTFIVIGVAANVLVALSLAVLLEQGLPGSSFFRGVFFVPSIMSLVIVGVVFTLLLSPSFGVVNPLLREIGLGEFERAWLGDRRTALYTVIAVDVWRSFGLNMFLFIAGLKSIDDEIYEAAVIDGASAWQTLRLITLPVLRPVLLMVITLTSIGYMKQFEIVYVMTFGGPNHASEVLNTWMYFQGFKFTDTGYGSAIAMVVLGLTLIMTLFQLNVFRVFGDEAGGGRA